MGMNLSGNSSWNQFVDVFDDDALIFLARGNSKDLGLF